MSLATTVHDLKTLVQSYHPAIVVETVEEDRVRQLLVAAAAELRLPLFEWSITHGLARLGTTQPVYGTADPLGVLKHLGSLRVEALVHLKDFGPHLGQLAVQRAFRDLADGYTRTRSTLVLTGDRVEIPSGLAHLFVHLELRPPGEDELRETVSSVLRSLRNTRRIEVALTPADWEALMRALSGLTLNQARQAVTYAALDAGRLASSDIQRIVDRKAQLLHDGGLLEERFVPVK